MLDEKFRQRVGALAATDSEHLDEQVRERIIARVAAEGPTLVKRARRVRLATAVIAPALAAAAVVALLVGRRTVGHDAQSSAAVSPPLACAGRSAPEGAKGGFVRDASGQKLDLGVTAFARASADSNVRLVEAAPCRTIIELS